MTQMTSRRSVLAGMGAIGLGGSLAACGGSGSSGSGKQKVTFWQFDTAAQAISAWEAAIKDFEAKNPDIEVQMEIVPWADQQQKITTGIATGELPDVSMMGNNVVAQYAASGNLAPLKSYIDQWSEEEGMDIVEDWYDGDISYYTYENEIYGSPVADETRMIFFNKELFEKAGLDPETPPTTWEEMQEAARALTDSGIIGWAAPMSKQYVTVQTFMSVYLSYGAELFDSSGQCALDSAEFKQALEYYTGIFTAGLTSPDAANQAQEDIFNLYSTGAAGMFIQGPNRYAALQSENPDLLKVTGIAPIPAGPEGIFGFLGGWPLVMWNTTEVPDAAAKFMHFASSPTGGLKGITETSGLLPGRKSLAAESPWSEEPYTSFAAQLEESYPYQYPAPPSPKMGQIEVEAIQTAVQQVATGARDIDTATKEMVEQINRIVNQ